MTQLFAVRTGLGVNLFGKGKAVFPSFGKAGELFEPRGPGSFNVNPSIEFLQRGMNRRVDGEFITARVNAEFQIVRQSVLPHGISDGCQIEFHLACKLRNVTSVVHTLVKTSTELGRYSL